MADYDKLNFENIDSIYSNNEGFRGGFFPIGEFNFWHGGIHLKGGADRKSYVTPIEDGEIIAYRVTKEYSSYSDNLVKEYRKYELEEAKSRATKEELKVLESSFKAKEKSPDYMELNDELEDEELIKHIFNSYSNNFVLVKHKKTVLEKDIIFYSLYMHLEVWNNYPKNSDDAEDEVVRPFFRNWKFKVTGDETRPGLKLSTGDIVHPYVRVVEVLNDEKNNLSIEDENPDTMEVSVQFSYDKNSASKEGYITFREGTNEFLEPLNQRKFTIKKDVKVYYDEARTAFKGELKKEVEVTQDKIRGGALSFPRIGEESREILFDCSNFEVLKVEGYIIDRGSGSFETSKVPDHFDVAADSFVLYDLEKAVEEIAKNDNGEQKVVPNNFLASAAMKDNDVDLKIYRSDIVELKEVEDENIKNYFPHAKWVKRVYTDTELPAMECKGWIDLNDLQISAITYKVLPDPIRRALDSGSDNVARDTNKSGLYMKNNSVSDGQVKMILDKDKEIELHGSYVNHINELRGNDNYFYCSATPSDSNGTELFYIKGSTLFEHTEAVKETRGDCKIEDSGNAVQVLDKPLPASKDSTILGAVGKSRFQKEIVHLELFLKDDTFIKLKAKESIKKNYFFKKGVYSLSKQKFVKEKVILPSRTLLKVVESKDDSDVMKVESYCNPPEKVYVKFTDFSDYPDGKYNYDWRRRYTLFFFTNKFGECDIYNIKKNDRSGEEEAVLLPKKGLKLKGQDINAGKLKYLNGETSWYGDGSYFHLELFTTLNKADRKSGFLLKSELPSNLKHYEGGYYELTQSDIEWYKEDPSVFKPGATETFKLGTETVVRSGSLKKAESKGDKWLGFDLNGKTGWITEKELEKHEKRSFEDKVLKDSIILDTFNVKNFFKIVEESDINEMKDGICDIDKLLDKADVKADGVAFKAALKKYLFQNKVTAKDTDAFFKPGVIYETMQEQVKETEKIRLVDYLRRMICKLPIEWEDWDDNSDKKKQMEKRLNKVPYKLSKTELDEFKAAVKDLSWFGKVKSKLEVDSNMLYFVHPATFLKSLRSLNTEFNPFKGKTVLNNEVVIDNPGFGVLVSNYNGNPHDFANYTPVTGNFNLDYSRFYRGRWIHEGLDLAGATGDSIMSFITGNIVVSGEGHVNYGEFYLIQNVNNPTHFYLISHLSGRIKKEGETIYPGEVVAYVGNTGGGGRAMNPHLHIGFYKIEDEKYKDKLISINERRGNRIYNFIFNAAKDIYFNPFNHNDPWRI